MRRFRVVTIAFPKCREPLRVYFRLRRVRARQFESATAWAASEARKSMSLREILMTRYTVAPWVLPATIICVGLYFATEALRPDGPGLIQTGNVEESLQSSADSIREVTQYIAHTDTLQRAIKEGDPEVIHRLMAEQEVLNQRMEEHLDATRANDAKRRAIRTVSVRQARFTIGILAALLISLGVWSLAASRSQSVAASL